LARPRINDFWIDRIELTRANDHTRSLSAVKIRDVIKRFQSSAPTELPSDRAIRRVIQEFDEKKDSEKLSQRYFSWPSSMDIGAVPWEGSRACLDLLAEFTKRGKQPPTNLLAERFWRVTQATSLDLEIATRVRLAMRLIVFSKLNMRLELEDVERYIAERRWQSDSLLLRRLPPLEVRLTKAQLARFDILMEWENFALVDVAAQRSMTRLRKGTGKRIPAAAPERVDPAALAARRKQLLAKVRKRPKRKES